MEELQSNIDESLYLECIKEEERIYLSGEMFRAESKRLTEEQKYVEAEVKSETHQGTSLPN